eukprot:Nitzschia sp. Nitz4//scaffold235_size30605//23295//24767//NITZ4_007979-RA/size30605-augustus-gene-0.21-mRNA-1//-1//CDS//3329543465//8395//frame0
MLILSRPLQMVLLLLIMASGATGNSAFGIMRLADQSPGERFLQVPTARPVLPAPINRPGGNNDDSLTASPTGSPITPPTGSPHQSPIRVPTRAPTLAPVRAPTRTPTLAPVRAPTRTPTLAPVRAPTRTPTLAPVGAPTRAPTRAPSRAPTVTPVVVPAPLPVEIPVTPVPTSPMAIHQSASPTGSPIFVPSGNAPQSPTRLPTRAPTLAPVRAPTRAPIVTPVVAPTPLPVETPVTPVQTPSPTLAQMRLPTGDPSNVTISAGGSSTNIAGALAGGFAAFLLIGFCLFLIRRSKNSETPPAPEEKKTQERPHGTRPSIASTLSKRSAKVMAELMLPPQEDVSTLGDPTFTSARKFMLENGEELFKVVAPVGKLGMVLGTTLDGGTPIVQAIEKTSPLADRVRVGDRLLSIDGEDCAGTAAVPIDAPELISRKSEKAARVLEFARYIDPPSDTLDSADTT